MLGFLLARRPDTFSKLFDLPHDLETIILEHQEDTGRSDIRIETIKRHWVIEAKLDSSNPLRQARRYTGQRRILLTNHVPPTSQQEIARVRWVTWQALADALKNVERMGNTVDGGEASKEKA
jgi:hypothetical protein